MAELLHINGSDTTVTGDQPINRVAQSFTPTAPWEVETVQIENIWIQDNAPGTATCYIFDDDGGEPGSELAVSNNQSAGEEAAPGETLTFTFASPPTLKAGVLYWLVLMASGPGGVYCNTYRTDSSVYPNGSFATRTGLTWTIESDYDINQMYLNGVTQTTTTTTTTAPTISGNQGGGANLGVNQQGFGGFGFGNLGW